MQTVSTLLTAAALACCAVCAPLAQAAQPLAYELQPSLNLGAPTKWDYTAVDAQRQRLYVTRGERVDVLEIPSGKAVGSIANTLGVHGVALAQDLKLGFSSNGKSNSVTVFDLDSLQTLAEIALSGKNPDAIVYEPLRREVYVFNGASGDFEVIDAVSRKLVGAGKVGGRPEFAVADGQGKVFFNIEDKAELAVIDTATHKIVSKWPLAGCTEPTGLALDAANGRLFSSCGNGIMAVTDAASGQRVAQFAIGEHPDAVVFDASTGSVLTSCGGGNGSLALAQQLDANHYATQPALATAKGAKTLAMDPKTRTVYLPTVQDGKFVVLVASPRR